MKESVNVEIRAAEGGKDSKLLADDMAVLYQKAARMNDFSAEVKH